MVKHTYEYVKNFIEGKDGNGCILLDTEYINIDNKLNVKCNCGNTFRVSFYDFSKRNKKQCNECGYKMRGHLRKLSFDFVKNFIENESNSGCILLSNNYDYYTKKLKLKCKCGNIFYADFASFRNAKKQQCNECSKINAILKKRKFNYEYVMSYINENDDTLLSSDEDYVDSNSKIQIKCKNNHTYNTTFERYHTQNKRCKICSTETSGLKRRKTNYEFKQEVFNLVGNEYKVLEKYITCDRKIKFLHSICGSSFKMTPNSFLAGSRCPKCNQSKGENKIYDVLKQNNVHFTPQYTFDNLLSDLGNNLKFDFAIFEDAEKTKIKCLIEFDGEQHYTWKKTWMTLEAFQKIQYHDKLKNDYCIKNDIKLIRIKYNEFHNINNIIYAELNANATIEAAKNAQVALEKTQV